MAHHPANRLVIDRVSGLANDGVVSCSKSLRLGEFVMTDTMPFEILGRVSVGQSGPVWKARDVGLDRIVALKEITGQSSGEARALAAIRSEHVVQIHGTVAEAGRLYLVEEWVEGATLAEVLRASGRLSPNQALSVLRGSLLGLAAVHQAGFVHGDLSATNVLVDAGGTSKLIDFGSVMRVGERAGRATGAFAAPEVVAGEVVTPASDVFGAAAVFAMLQHGRAESRSSTKGVDPAIRPVLDRALSQLPSARYRDAAEFLAALEDAAERRYGTTWFSEAGLGAIATVVVAGLLTEGLSNVPFAGSAGDVTLGVGTSGKRSRHSLLVAAASVAVMATVMVGVLVWVSSGGDPKSAAGSRSATAAPTLNSSL